MHITNCRINSSINPVTPCFDGGYHLSLPYEIENQCKRKIADVQGDKKLALVRIVRQYVFYYTEGRMVVCLVRNIVCTYQTGISECYDCLKLFLSSKDSLLVSRCSTMTLF